MEHDFAFVALSFLAVALVFTFLVKRFTRFDTFLVISLIKTAKPLAFFDRLACHKKILDAFAWLGLLFGFGAFSIDFHHGRRLGFPARAALFAASALVLSLVFLGLDSVLGNALSQSPIVAPFFPLMLLSFSIMGLAGFTLFSLFLQAWEIVSNALLGLRSCPGIAPLIPGVEIPGVPITPPLHAWVSLIIILIVHEAMHGIIGRRHGFRLKSTGVILFGFLPIGAFVEPDEQQLRTAKDSPLLAFLAGGPMANIALMVVAGLALLGSALAFGAMTNHLYPGIGDSVSGVEVAGVLEEVSFCNQTHAAPAFGILEAGDVIKSVNGSVISNSRDLFSALGVDRHAEKIFIVERSGSGLSLVMKPTEFGQFGFFPRDIPNPDYAVPPSYESYAQAANLVVEFLYWLFLLNFLVASINFLPMNPFDGGRIARVIFTPYLGFLRMPTERLRSLIGRFFLILILTLFAVNALPLFV